MRELRQTRDGDSGAWDSSSLAQVQVLRAMDSHSSSVFSESERGCMNIVGLY
jgi:hypothetical protein